MFSNTQSLECPGLDRLVFGTGPWGLKLKPPGKLASARSQFPLATYLIDARQQCAGFVGRSTGIRDLTDGSQVSPRGKPDPNGTSACAVVHDPMPSPDRIAGAL